MKKLFQKGQPSAFKGKKHSVEAKLEMSVIKKGKHISPKTEFKKGYISWNKGLKKSIDKRIDYFRPTQFKQGAIVNNESKLKMSISRLGSKNPQWKGGISFKPYPLGWNRTFKEQIRYRDGYKCQMCGVAEIDCESKLCVHHIDFDKTNLNEKNLISLCRSCHGILHQNKGRKLCQEVEQETLRGM